MTIREYKTVFSDYNCGYASFVHLLSKPIAAMRDTALKQEDSDKLKQAIGKSEKNTNIKLGFVGNSNLDKALQLSLLAYQTKQAVCFIDCQLLVNKYIGETEKNLSKLVALAESENWILFFDEADALFGKRSETKEIHDQFANQEVSYLIKRLSQYPGLTILSFTEKSKLHSIQYAIDSVITFR